MSMEKEKQNVQQSEQPFNCDQEGFGTVRPECFAQQNVSKDANGEMKNSATLRTKHRRYYHTLLENFYRFVIPPNMRVLQVGDRHSYLLNAVQPVYGVQTNNVLELIPEPFDYIILSNTTMEVEDVQSTLQNLKPFCTPSTRIVIDTYNYLWEPVLKIAQKLKLASFKSSRHWLSQYDLVNLLNIAGFEVVTANRDMLVPIYIPGVSWFFNNIIGPAPFINKLCLSSWIIARPGPVATNASASVTVVVPCRNERGNIEAAITRTPKMGSHMEFIFVEGHSKDGTLDEIKRVAAAYPDHDISYFVQSGKGKGGAVREAFARAKGDVLMILDADLTMPPEELPKFYDALVSGKGEFINGSRLVYGMEEEAMRFLNLLANHGFSLIFTWLLNQRVKDTLCGTKVLYKRDYERIVTARHFFGDFDPYGDFDLLFGAAKQNLKIIDMPVHYKARTYGTSQISRFSGGVLLTRMSLIGWHKFKWRA